MHPESLQTSDLGAFFVRDNNFSWGLESSGGGSEPDIHNLCNFFCALWNPVGESAGLFTVEGSLLEVKTHICKSN